MTYPRGVKRTAAGAAGLSVAVLLTACSNAAPDAPGETGTAGDEKITVQLAHWGGDWNENEVYKPRIEAFMAEHPNIIVEPLPVAEEYETKMTTLINAGQAPTLMQVAENGTRWAGAFRDLTTQIEAEGWDLAERFGGAAELYNDGNIQFAVPDRGGSTVLYFNKDLFEEAGLPLPDENFTVDDYYNALEKITALSGTIDVDGDGQGDPIWGGTGTHYQAAWGAFLLGNGGSIIEFDAEGEPVVTVNSPQNAEVFDRWVGAYANDWILPYENTVEKGGDAWFQSGNVGMNMTGFWVVKGYAETEGLNWDMSTIPLGEVESGWPMGSGFAISAQASDEEAAAAWEVAKYLSGDEGQAYLAETLADAPASLEALTNLQYETVDGNPVSVDRFAIVQQRLTTIDGYVRGPWYSEVNNESRTQVRNAVEGAITVPELLENLEENLTKIVARY
ncbi:MAG TPA: extracellular solute-binding protein [Arachnia sp.]|nr:extracellular solute-binding protein [Arachnia sp.]HMT84752.1 extracellular solute-binding protein [Arachnia sp.]